MGICRCNEKGVSCGIHFFKKAQDPAKYEEKKKSFTKKTKKGSVIPEFEVKEDTKEE